MCVVHCKRDEYDVYIGRPRRGANQVEHFGNPFSHQRGTGALVLVPTRDDAVKEFENWLNGGKWELLAQDQRAWILDNLHKLRGKTIACWCSPLACHGDVLSKLANG